MQEQKTKADEATRGGPYLSPARAFLAIFLLVAVFFGVWIVRLSGDPVSESSLASPNETTAPQVLEEDALREWRSLRLAALEAIRAKDPTLIPRVFTATSPLRRIAEDQIRSLKDRRVRDKSQIDILAAKVARRTDAELIVRETSVLRPCFINGRGEDVTDAPNAVRQEANWTLHVTPAGLLIHDIDLLRESVVEAGHGFCR